MGTTEQVEQESFDTLEERFIDNSVLETQRGTASYYSDKLVGHLMANGRAYDPRRPTMAHRTLPFGTIVKIVRPSTGAQVIVEVTDRGPFGDEERIADVSREAARRLGMLKQGVVEVELEVLVRGSGKRTPAKRRAR